MSDITYDFHLSNSNVQNNLKLTLKNIWNLVDDLDNLDDNDFLIENLKKLNGIVTNVIQCINSDESATFKNLYQNGTTPLILIKIIKKTNDFNTCMLAVNTLYKIINKNLTISDSDKTHLIKLFTDPNNYQQIFELLELIHLKYFMSNSITIKNEIHLKLLKILDCLSSKRPRYQFSNVTCENVKYMQYLLSENKNKKEQAEIILNLLKLICRTKKFCQILGTRDFFDNLQHIIKLTNQGEIIGKIIRTMSKCPEALIEMRHSQNILPLILNLANTYPTTRIMRKSLITILYRISKKVPEQLSSPNTWNSLLDLFKSYEQIDDQRLRMTIIKMYTLLNLGTKRNVINTSSLKYQPNFSQKIKQQLRSASYEDSENDNDYTDDDEDDDDEHSFLNNQESDISDDEISITSSTSFDDLTKISSSNEDISFMKNYFMEFFNDNWIDDSKQIKFFEFLKNDFGNTKTYELYQKIGQHVKRDTYNKHIAFPDAVSAEVDNSDNCNICNNNSNRFSFAYLIKKVKIAKGTEENNYFCKVIYNLDELLSDEQTAVDIPSPENFVPRKQQACASKASEIHIDLQSNHSASPPTLTFESRFESGNLRYVEQVDDFEYNLLLTPDVCTCRGHQWFYFQLSNMITGKPYTFNIINFDKINSQFNYGMQPVLFSVTDFVLNGTGWRRVGEKIVYYGNNYTNEDYSKQYRTLTFTITFDYNNDYCYLAYHYPYTYTKLLNQLFNFYLHDNNIYSRIDNLCTTVNSNYVPLITITAAEGKDSFGIPIDKRPIVFFTSRVHPGESNSSWILDGIMKFLLNENDEKAKAARELYIFKIIPMLNPEGVIFGNTRNGLTGCDLNRCWSHPNKHLHPEIYYTKKLVEYVRKELKHPITAFIDIHGHSRKKYFFFYGCNPQLSWNKNDKLQTAYENYQVIPDETSFNQNMKGSFCQYKIEKKKETTCRVVMWREFAIKGSYTLECSYCSGENKKKMTTKILQDIGKSLVVALSNLASKCLLKKEKFVDFGLDYKFLETVKHYPEPEDTIKLESTSITKNQDLIKTNFIEMKNNDNFTLLPIL